MSIFREKLPAFVPRTPQAALLGLKSGVVSPEHFIAKRLSLMPLNYQPYDIQEVERVLAHRNLDEETVLLLVDILRDILQDPDREIAQVAAESLTSLENRYVQRIQGFKEILEYEDDELDQVKLMRGLAEDLRILALMYRHQRILSRFYFKEAFVYSNELFSTPSLLPHLSEQDAIAHIVLLLDLGIPGQARAEIEKTQLQELCQASTLENLRNRIYFAQGHFRKVRFHE
ncbi:MAG: hypothetical protein GW949_04335 [Spirochaetales bacterium]|nr:hypothetical protein [Spirochaetales bacterium]